MLQRGHGKLLCVGRGQGMGGWILLGPTMCRKISLIRETYKQARSQRWNKVMGVGRSKKIKVTCKIRGYCCLTSSFISLASRAITMIFISSPASSAGCPASIRGMTRLSFGAGVGRQWKEVVGLFPSVFVAQGILWVMLEDKLLS